MSMIKTSDLRRLDVVNMEEGRYLGSVCDLDVDPDTGRVLALIVDRVTPFRFFWVRGTRIWRSPGEMLWLLVLIVFS